MSKVSISEAIRLSGVSRSQFYTKYINKGCISVTVDDGKKLIDTSELIRVFGNIQLSDSTNEQVRTIENTSKHTDKDKIIELLEQQLKESKQREVEARDREEWLKTQLEKTTHLLEDKTEKDRQRKKFLGIF
jgi:phage terminase small subunit